MDFSICHVIDEFQCYITLNPQIIIFRGVIISSLAIEKFVCQPYICREQESPLSKSCDGSSSGRSKHNPTGCHHQAGLHQAILRAHYQMMVLNRNKLTNPELSSSQHYGWQMDQDEWLLVMTKLPPVLEAIQLVKYGC